MNKDKIIYKAPFMVTALLLFGCGSGSSSDSGTPAPAPEENNAPVFTSTANENATVGSDYSYTVTASDADNDTLTLSASTKPAWLNFDAETGLLSGQVSEAEVGAHNVTIAVTDATVTVNQDFMITVAADASGNWQLVWSDEFDGDAIDATKWSHEVNCWGGGNSEQQCYTDRDVNSSVSDGILTITAQREDFTGANNPDGDNSQTATLPYTSARLRTIDKGDWQYGRFEIRAKLPFGQGTWPAIWMLPTDWVYGGWPRSGEIDIMEAVNLKVMNNGAAEASVHGTLHYGQAWPDNVSSGEGYTLPNDANPADDFHTYAIEWEESEIRWYVDGVHFATHRDTGWYTQYVDNGELVNGTGDAPFDQRFHLLLNLAVGGNWAANTHDQGVNEAIFPQTLEVDFVRVYECSVLPEKGTGCATVGTNPTIVEGNAAPEIIPPIANFGEGPVFNLYQDALIEGLAFNSYDPDNNVTSQEIAVDGKGSVIEMIKDGATGNLYLEYPPKVDLSHFSGDGELVFDIRVTSMDSGATLLVKIDSGWPSVSDYIVPLPALNEWTEVRLDVEDIVLNGNSLSAGGIVDITNVVNVFVLEPSASMALQVDNVRFEQ